VLIAYAVLTRKFRQCEGIAIKLHKPRNLLVNYSFFLSVQDLTSAFGGQRSIQLSYGCVEGPLAKPYPCCHANLPVCSACGGFYEFNRLKLAQTAAGARLEAPAIILQYRDDIHRAQLIY
jgi:hypothetical protein